MFSTSLVAAMPRWELRNNKYRLSPCERAFLRGAKDDFSGRLFLRSSSGMRIASGGAVEEIPAEFPDLRSKAIVRLWPGVSLGSSKWGVTAS
jgi:hypothetical protein